MARRQGTKLLAEWEKYYQRKYRGYSLMWRTPDTPAARLKRSELSSNCAILRGTQVNYYLFSESGSSTGSIRLRLAIWELNDCWEIYDLSTSISTGGNAPLTGLWHSSLWHLITINNTSTCLLKEQTKASRRARAGWALQWRWVQRLTGTHGEGLWLFYLKRKEKNGR